MKMILLSFISYASTELPLELMLGSLDHLLIVLYDIMT